MTSAATRRILLISESADELEMYAAAFRRKGFCTLLARTSTDAYRLASELHPAAIVADQHFDGDNTGLRLTRRFREDEQTRRVPLVILSSYLFADERESAEGAACDLVVPKPCLPDDLSQLVAGLVESRS